MMFVSLTLTLSLKSYGRVWRFIGHYITQLLLLYASSPERVLQERDLQVPFILKKAPGVGQKCAKIPHSLIQQKHISSAWRVEPGTHENCIETPAVI